MEASKLQVNLEIALVAKNANPDVRVVARVFDHDLAGRLQYIAAADDFTLLAQPAEVHGHRRRAALQPPRNGRRRQGRVVAEEGQDLSFALGHFMSPKTDFGL